MARGVRCDDGRLHDTRSVAEACIKDLLDEDFDHWSTMSNKAAAAQAPVAAPAAPLGPVQPPAITLPALGKAPDQAPPPNDAGIDGAEHDIDNLAQQGQPTPSHHPTERSSTPLPEVDVPYNRTDDWVRGQPTVEERALADRLEAANRIIPPSKEQQLRSDNRRLQSEIQRLHDQLNEQFTAKHEPREKGRVWYRARAGRWMIVVFALVCFLYRYYFYVVFLPDTLYIQRLRRERGL